MVVRRSLGREGQARALAMVVAVTAALTACGSGGSTTAATVAPTAELPGPAITAPNGKKVFKADQTDIRVVVGEKFAIRVPSDPAKEDDWRMVSQPDDSFVKFSETSFKADPSGSSAGQQEFEFKAKKPGTTTVTLEDCRGCTTTPSTSPLTRLTFTITVS